MVEFCSCCQGIYYYYYFYQLFKNKAEAIAVARKINSLSIFNHLQVEIGLMILQQLGGIKAVDIMLVIYMKKLGYLGLLCWFLYINYPWPSSFSSCTGLCEWNVFPLLPHSSLILLEEVLPKLGAIAAAGFDMIAAAGIVVMGLLVLLVFGGKMWVAAAGNQ
ncbi:hypothetical protein PTKIN_Ptkin14bG0032300 [Pterospermum kingtungense]